MPQLAVGTAVLDGDEELLRKKRGQDAYVALFICLRPFLFKRDDFVGVGGPLLRVCEKQQARQEENDELGKASSPHRLLSHSLSPVPSRLWVTFDEQKIQRAGLRPALCISSQLRDEEFRVPDTGLGGGYVVVEPTVDVLQ